MDIWYGYGMDIWYGYMIWIYDMDIWYGYMKWMCEMDIWYGYMIWIYDMDIWCGGSEEALRRLWGGSGAAGAQRARAQRARSWCVMSQKCAQRARARAQRARSGTAAGAQRHGRPKCVKSVKLSSKNGFGRSQQVRARRARSGTAAATQFERSRKNWPSSGKSSSGAGKMGVGATGAQQVADAQRTRTGTAEGRQRVRKNVLERDE